MVHRSGKYCACSIEGITASVEGGQGVPESQPYWPEPPGWPSAEWWDWPTPPGTGGDPPPGGDTCDPESFLNPCETFTASLTCPVDVTRGDPGECELEIEPAEALDQVDQWLFTGDQGHIVSSGQGGTTWGGTLVETGVVRVTFIALGREGQVSTPLIVLPRPSAWTSQWSFSDGGAPVPSDGQTGKPHSGDVLRRGWNCSMPNSTDCGPKGFIRPDYEEGEVGGFTVSQAIPSGPNAGLYYVSDMSFYSSRGSAFNPILTASGGEVHTSTDPLQASCSPMNWYYANDCLGGSSSDDLRVAVLLHEGYGSTGSNGHQSFRESLAAQAQHDPWITAEAVVRSTSQQVTDNVTDLVKAVSVVLEAANTALGEPTGNFPPAYRFSWDEATSRWFIHEWTGG